MEKNQKKVTDKFDITSHRSFKYLIGKKRYEKELQEKRLKKMKKTELKKYYCENGYQTLNGRLERIEIKEKKISEKCSLGWLLEVRITSSMNRVVD